MKRPKYTQRRTGEDRISQEFLELNFGGQNTTYKLVWNGHSHFAMDECSGRYFYINKKGKTLLPIEDFWLYRNYKKTLKT